MSVDITWSTLNEDFQVLCLLILIDGEVEVGLSLNLLVDIRSHMFDLFLLEFFFKLKVINFLSNELSNFALDVFYVMMIVALNFANACKDALLVLWISESA